MENEAGKNYFYFVPLNFRLPAKSVAAAAEESESGFESGESGRTVRAQPERKRRA